MENQIEDDLMDVNSLQNMKQFLVDENVTLNERLKVLDTEIEKLDDSISSSSAYIASYNGKKEDHEKNTEKLKTKKEALIEYINDLKNNFKTIDSDLERSSALIDALMMELGVIQNERDIMIAKIRDMEDEIKNISLSRERKLPRLRGYNETLKRANRIFREAENRINLTMRLRKLR